MDSGREASLIALGASTGGPQALADVVASFPAELCAAVVIVQHISADFAPSLVECLQQRARLPVRLALGGDCPLGGEILVAGSNDHLVLGKDRRFSYTTEPMDYPYRPSVDVLFASLAAHWPKPGVAVLLTGMGADGARGLLQLRQAGWFTLAQDQSSCVVYGMPQAAAQLGAACQILPLPRLARAILERLGH
ncbi:MAG: chemotaxis protein CheB [Gemmataceae bacterium]